MRYRITEVFKENLTNIYEKIDEFKKDLFRKNQENLLGQPPDYFNKENKKEGKKPNFDILNKIFI